MYEPREWDVTIRGGVPSADAITVFTDGDCWALAVAIHDLTGWPLVAAGVGPDADWWDHVLVETPNGKLMDIHGEQDRSTVRAEWGRLGPVTREQAQGDCLDKNQLSFVSNEVARAIARALVSHWKTRQNLSPTALY